MRLSFGQEMHSELELILIVKNNIFTGALEQYGF